MVDGRLALAKTDSEAKKVSEEVTGRPRIIIHRNEMGGRTCGVSTMLGAVPDHSTDGSMDKVHSGETSSVMGFSPS